MGDFKFSRIKKGKARRIFQVAQSDLRSPLSEGNGYRRARDVFSNKQNLDIFGRYINSINLQNEVPRRDFFRAMSRSSDYGVIYCGAFENNADLQSVLSHAHRFHQDP